MIDIASLKSQLTENPKVLITMHRSPDGDAVGSSLGLSLFLKKIGCEVTVVAPDPFPDFLKWLPESEQIIIFELDPEDAQTAAQNADLIFCLDFNTPSRMGNFEQAVLDASATKVMIDHHQEPSDFVNFMLSDPTTSSTCELIYRFISELDMLNELDADIGKCIYTGMVTDTGSFRFSAVGPQTHKIAAHLLEVGVNHTEVHVNLFDSYTESRLKLLGYTLSEKLTVIPDAGTAYLSLTQDEMRNFEFKKGDTEGLVNYALSISGVNFAAFFRESQDGYIKISFRSKGTFDVNRFARAHYHGGGHLNAAGGRSDLNMQDTLDIFEELVEKEIANIVGV